MGGEVGARLIQCPECGAPHEEATQALVEKDDVIEGLERDLRSKRSAIAKLQKANVDPGFNKRRKEACEVLDRWHEKLAPKAREVHSDKRLEKVVARLRGGFSVAELQQCVDGYEKRPYVVDGKRVSSGPPEKRYVEVDTIFKDEAKVRAGMGFAEQPAPAPQVNLETADWRKVRYANFRAILRSLKAKLGEPYHDEIARAYHDDCPACAGNLTLFEPSLMTDSLLFCNCCDISESNIFQALDALPDRDDHKEVFAA